MAETWTLLIPTPHPRAGGSRNGWQQKIREGTAAPPRSLQGRPTPQETRPKLEICKNPTKENLISNFLELTEGLKVVWNMSGRLQRRLSGGRFAQVTLGGISRPTVNACFLSCASALALEPRAPPPPPPGTPSGRSEAKILLSARGRAWGGGDGPLRIDRWGRGFHYVNWLLGQQRGRGAAKLYDWFRDWSSTATLLSYQ